MKTKVALPFETAYALSTTAIFIAVTPWMDAGDILRCRWLFELRCPTGNFQAAFGYETADVDNSVSGGVLLGTYQSAADVYFPSAFTDLSSALEGKQKVRFGWMCKLSSGAVLSMGRCGGYVEIVTR
jgi:hypothetical protein